MAAITSCSSSSFDLGPDTAQYGCQNAYDGQTAAYRSRADSGKAWASDGEGVGSWIELGFDRPTVVNTMQYYNRDAHGVEATGEETATELATKLQSALEGAAEAPGGQVLQGSDYFADNHETMLQEIGVAGGAAAT